MPQSRTLPHDWFNTPNIHLCTVQDFEKLCTDKNVSVLNRSIVNHDHKNTLGTKLLPNLFGQIALYQIKKIS